MADRKTAKSPAALPVLGEPQGLSGSLIFSGSGSRLG